MSYTVLHCSLNSNRPESGRKKGEMATDVNPAYGMSAPRHRAPPETKGDYEYTQPPSVAPEEGVYEGVY